MHTHKYEERHGLIWWIKFTVSTLVMELLYFFSFVVGIMPDIIISIVKVPFYSVSFFKRKKLSNEECEQGQNKRTEKLKRVFLFLAGLCLLVIMFNSGSWINPIAWFALIISFFCFMFVNIFEVYALKFVSYLYKIELERARKK